MPDTIRIKAAPGRRVRHPETMAVLPEEGIDVDPADTFWFRRLAAEDVVIVPADSATVETGRASRKPASAE
jgi:hypothetical protein